MVTGEINQKIKINQVTQARKKFSINPISIEGHLCDT